MALRRWTPKQTAKAVVFGIWLLAFAVNLRYYSAPDVKPEPLLRDPVTGQINKPRQIRGRSTVQELMVIYLVIGAGLYLFFVLVVDEKRPRRRGAVRPQIKQDSARELAARRLPLQCPHCGSTNIKSSKRRSKEWIHSAVLLKTYRCHNCFRRFRRSRLRLPKRKSEPRP